MKAASYAVVRFVADPARNEPVNVGIVAWDDVRRELRIDATALERVIRDNPHLHRDSLLYLDPFLRERLAPADVVENSGHVPDLLARQNLFPVMFTEPRHTTLVDGSSEAMTATIDRLMERVVHPKRRTGGGRPQVFKNYLAKRFTPLINQKVIERDHVFAASKSGAPRSVDFFANSSANVVLDVLRLNIGEAKEIRLRADAEAYKIVDVTSTNDVDYMVLCDFRRDAVLQEANRLARQSVESAGARIITDPDQAAEYIEQRVRSSQNVFAS